MSERDEFDAYPASIASDRAHLSSPRALLTLLGAHHLPPYADPTDPHFDVVITSTIDFLDGTVKRDPDAFARLDAAIMAAPTLATLERS